MSLYFGKDIVTVDLGYNVCVEKRTMRGEFLGYVRKGYVRKEE
jgi:hypothetical protein